MLQPEIMEKIRKDYISHPGFNPASVKKVSAAMTSLCKWVLGMEKYDRVAKVNRFL